MKVWPDSKLAQLMSVTNWFNSKSSIDSTIQRTNYTKCIHLFLYCVTNICKCEEGSSTNIFCLLHLLQTCGRKWFQLFSRVCGKDIPSDPYSFWWTLWMLRDHFKLCIWRTIGLGAWYGSCWENDSNRLLTPQCFKIWLNEMIIIIQREGRGFYKSKAPDRVLKIGGPFIDYLKDK